MREETPVGENKEDESFIFISFKKEFTEEYCLPDKPFPIRFSVAQKNDINGRISFRDFADECHAYCEKNIDVKEEFSNLQTRLDFLAGIESGRAGDDSEALDYLSRAFSADTNDLDIAVNCALALVKNDMHDNALELYEFIVETHFDGGKKGFSEMIWKMAVKLNCLKGNFDRALELLGATIPTASMEFVADAAATVRMLREALGTDNED